MNALALILFSFLLWGSVNGQTALDEAFEVPPQFRGDYGDFRSVLRFEDGSPVRSAEDWERRRAEIRRVWENHLGKWPDLIEKPRVRILSESSRERATERKIQFQWTPSQWTTAYLLIPERADQKEKLPAVLTVFYEPETAVGRGNANPNRDFARLLTEKGFVTLSIGTTEATEVGTYALYWPSIDSVKVEPLSMLAYAAANAWFVLAEQPEVDAARIGITGHSFGGKWALFAGALFDQFAAVAVSDPGIVFDTRPSVNYWEPWYLGWHPRPWRKRGVLSEENPARGLYPILREEGRDLHELHALLAPRPFFVSGGSEDPPTRWRALNHLIAINEILGYQNRVAMTNRQEHSPSEESNAVLIEFFEKFLQPGE